MQHAPDKDTLAEIAQLLLNPLLINYTGQALEYVRQRSSEAEKDVRATLGDVIAAVENYLEGLRSVGTLPELHPTTAQREAYYRVQSRMMADSYKEAEKQSVFLSILHKSVLLYGRKSVTYVYGPNGSYNRVETPLHSHSFDMEVPRGQQLDPFGTDYTLRVFRMEQWRR